MDDLYGQAFAAAQTMNEQLWKYPGPKMGRKDDAEKIPYDLLPRPALDEISKVLAFGAKKYSRYNWRSGIVYSRVLAACLRHVHAFNDGEDLDPETGLSHLAHAGCCIAFLLTYIKEHPECDDRYKP